MQKVKTIIRGLVPEGLRKRLLVARYAGDQHECPCCEGTFKTFWPSGFTRILPNTLCPQCHSLPRHRLLWLYLNAHKALFQAGIKMLHIAPEPIFTRLLQQFPQVDYLSADLMSPLAMVKMDITDIQYPDETFDAILCYHVLEHVPEDVKAMRELRRVLKPTGWAILQSPMETDREQTYEDWSIVTPEGRLKAFNQEDHVRIYGRDYRNRLELAGLCVKVDGFVREMDVTLRERYRLEADEDIYFCTREVSTG